MVILVLKGLLALVVISLGLYSLSNAPRKGVTRKDYANLWNFIRQNFFKITTAVLLLYAVWLTYIHQKGKDESREYVNKYFNTQYSLDSCVGVNDRLHKKIDSLKNSVR